MSEKIRILGLGLCVLLLLFHHGVGSVDYGLALTKSLLYFEAQRSGKLPANQRVTWRGDSGLEDGSDMGVDLVGGYYDAGDNVKFGFPMAFTITMLAWSIVEFGSQLAAKNELSNALDALKWGTDYLLKAHTAENVLYGQVGDGNSDHECWERPEDMDTPRYSYQINNAEDGKHYGSDLAGETAAALAAASMAFKKSNFTDYGNKLIQHSFQLYDFAKGSIGNYDQAIPLAKKFYPSSGSTDELMWAAAWIIRATGDIEDFEEILLDAVNEDDAGGIRSVFSWDDKYIGVQVLIPKMLAEWEFQEDGGWELYKNHAQEYICSIIQRGPANLNRTSGGLLWWQPWNNLQYTTATVFLLTVYADYLTSWQQNIECDGGPVKPSLLTDFARSQVDYILGVNRLEMSYMVGFGTNYPKKVHHRAASIVSIKNDSTHVTCQGGFDSWYYNNEADPNVLEGAIVGGPGFDDSYIDSRSNYQQSEPPTVNTAPLVGVLARLAVAA